MFGKIKGMYSKCPTGLVDMEEVKIPEDPFYRKINHQINSPKSPSQDTTTRSNRSWTRFLSRQLCILIGITIVLIIVAGFHLEEFKCLTSLIRPNEKLKIPSQGQGIMLTKEILNEPPWVGQRNWGLQSRKTNWTFKDFESSSLDKEIEISWLNFFTGTSGGLMVELGAMDGKLYSASTFFETKANWRVILIEAGSLALEIPKNRPNALCLHLAVCEKLSRLHYADEKYGGLGGIIEFMDLKFLQNFYPQWLTEAGRIASPITTKVNHSSHIDWIKVGTDPLTHEVNCLPFQVVFDHYRITRVNFMVLDLEGGELAALRSLDWNRIQFDLLCIETNRFNNPSDPYIDQVINFLLSNGYTLLQRTAGRNSWLGLTSLLLQEDMAIGFVNRI